MKHSNKNLPFPTNASLLVIARYKVSKLVLCLKLISEKHHGVCWRISQKLLLQVLEYLLLSKVTNDDCRDHSLYH